MESPFTDRDALAALCRRHHIHRFSLFGSVARGEGRPDSVVEFEPGREPGLLGMARIESELSALLDGRKVDLRTGGDPSRFFRDEVIREAEIQYDAA